MHNAKSKVKENIQFSVTWFVFQGQQDVRGGDCRVRGVSNIEQGWDGIGLQLLSPSWRPGNLLKLALLKVILGEKKNRKVHTDTFSPNTRALLMHRASTTVR